MTRIRHTVIFTWYDIATDEQKQEVLKRLSEMGDWLTANVGVTDWVVAEHIDKSYKPGRANLLQDCIFPDAKSLKTHASSSVHQRVVELTSTLCDWMTIDTEVK